MIYLTVSANANHSPGLSAYGLNSTVVVRDEHNMINMRVDDHTEFWKTLRLIYLFFSPILLGQPNIEHFIIQGRHIEKQCNPMDIFSRAEEMFKKK